MSRPIGPRERAWLDAAEAHRRARELVARANEISGMDSTGDDATVCECNAEDAREMDAAAETWLEWTWDEGERQFTSRIAGHNTPFRVVFSPLYRKAGVDLTPWSAICDIDYAVPILRYATPDEGKALFEDRIRKRGQFAPKGGAT